MRALVSAVVFLSAAGSAWAQSLLGENGGSPYDPPKAPVYRRHDRLKVRLPAAPEAPAEAGRRTADVRPADASTVMTVEVADIRPNGVLVVQAVRRRRVNGAEEVLRLTGEVAPKDVAGGEVPLDHVANLSLAYDGAALRLPGWLLGAFGRIGSF